MIQDPMLDKDFLKQLDERNEREVYVKIVSLDWDENPIAEIQGNVTQGGVNVDGSSALRRTCNLTLVTTASNVNELDWTLRTKFKVYIGLKNTINEIYDPIIWFKQGTFIITSFNSTLNGSGYTITIQGKDKMCLLNGDIGGSLFASHDFGGIWTLNDDGSSQKEDIAIIDIIREAIHTYALEDYANIIINDLDGWSVELLDYKAKNATLWIYEILTNAEAGTWTTNIGFHGSSAMVAQFEALTEANKNLIPTYNEVGPAFQCAGQTCRIIKIVEYGETAGYRTTVLTYPDELVIAAGGSVTQMLDKLTAMLGEFEYFYDVDGRFHFQRKQIHMNVSWNNAITNEDETYYDTVAATSARVYEFNRGMLVESFQNKPQVNNIKNDFSIWGTLKGDATEIPIHLRYAIDDKPKYYYSYSRKKVYISSEVGGPYDWRELIYQMACDDLIWHGKLESEKSTLRAYGLEQVITAYSSAITGIYDDDIALVRETYLNTWNKGYDAYYADMLAFWPQIYRTDRSVSKVYNDDGTLDMTAMNLKEQQMTGDTLNTTDWQAWTQNNYWNPDYVLYNWTTKRAELIHPEKLLFWIDFFDSESELADYKVSVIGRRPKVVNDKDVKAICYRDTPLVLFTSSEDTVAPEAMNMSYTRINLTPSIAGYFKISTQGKSAKDVLDTLAYQHTYYQESITLSAIPVYYLEPNTRIKVYDEISGINGEYIIKSISYQLAYDGMMSIQATKAEERIL